MLAMKKTNLRISKFQEKKTTMIHVAIILCIAYNVHEHVHYIQL